MSDLIITNIEIDDYLASLVPPRPAVLAELEERARQHGLSLVGPVEGSLLYLLARSIGAKRALEIGTTTGYAAIWLLQALTSQGGTLTAVERNPERYALARQYVSQAGYEQSLNIHQGDWQQVLPTLEPGFDLIFLDILRSQSEEQNAVRALEECVRLLRPGGMLIGDNVLCNALVLETEDVSPTVRGIQLFNQTVMSHPQLESVILPLRDGVSISRKRDL